MEEGKASPAAGSLSSQRCLVDLLDDDDAAIEEDDGDIYIMMKCLSVCHEK